MSITINLPPAAEEQLRAHAAATEKNISTLVAEAVEAKLALAQIQLKDILAPVHADVLRSRMTGAELDALLGDSLEQVRSERRSGPDSST